jgi:hypothetical protein
MVVKTFRGSLADGTEDRIRLSTIKGKVGYKIVKFQTIAADPAGASTKSVTQMWKTSQSSIGGAINFSDSDLLAAAYISHNLTSGAGSYNYVVFDNEIFNQDIFVSSAANPGPVNYYIELEVIPLDDAGAEYTTLKDMRQT